MKRIHETISNAFIDSTLRMNLVSLDVMRAINKQRRSFEMLGSLQKVWIAAEVVLGVYRRLSIVLIVHQIHQSLKGC